MSGCSDCGGCIRTGGITLKKTSHFQFSPVTLLCSSPALPSPQPRVSPAGRGRPSTWTGPFLLPGSEPWMLGTWPGWLSCQHERSDELQPKRQENDVRLMETLYRNVNCSFRFEDHQHQICFSSHRFSGLTDFGSTSLVPHVHTCAHHFSNQGRQVRRHLTHLRAQVFL